MIPLIFLINKLGEREMELHLVIEILNYVLNGRNTPTMFQGFIWHRRQVTQTLLNVRPRYWVGHFRKTNFLMRAQRWKHREKRHSLWNSDRGISYGS